MYISYVFESGYGVCIFHVFLRVELWCVCVCVCVYISCILESGLWQCVYLIYFRVVGVCVCAGRNITRYITSYQRGRLFIPLLLFISIINQY